MELWYQPSFVRQMKKLDPKLREEVYERVDDFKDPANHKRLKVHKLSGRMFGKYSFSVDYKNRVVFKYAKSKKIAILLDVGDHDIYE